MAARKYSLLVPQAMTGKRLDQVLVEWLPTVVNQPLSKAKVRTLLAAGVVYLNGTRVKIASKELRFKARLEVFFDAQALRDGDAKLAHDEEFQLTESSILFEDEWLIAISKPYGLPTQPTLDPTRPNLYDLLKKFLGERGGQSEAYVGLHHRLDRDTSGVILFTKKKEANFGVGEIFKQHLAQKTYWAIAKTPAKGFPMSWKVENYLAKAKGTGKQSRMQSVHSGGDRAVTEFRLLSLAKGVGLVEASPLTGRMHQIRVHLSENGAPILGDATYGDRSAAPRLMLHAVNLTFPHPLTKVKMSIFAPIPQDFTECLKNHELPLPPSSR